MKLSHKKQKSNKQHHVVILSSKDTVFTQEVEAKPSVVSRSPVRHIELFNLAA